MNVNVPLQLKVGGIALILVGALAAVISGISLLQGRQAQSWPAVDARVLRSEIEVSKKVGGIRRGQAVHSDYFTPVIRYEYVVNGKTYMGSRISFDESDTSGHDRRDAEKCVRKYPVGASIRIHYAPDQPQQSIIDPTPNNGFLAILFILGKLALIGGVVLCRTANQMQPAEEPAPVAVRTPTVQEAPILAPARSTHWVIKTISVVMGLLFFLFGSLLLLVSVKQYVQAFQSAEDAKHGVHIVMIVIMSGLTLFGAFLIWRPLKRATPTVAMAAQ